MKRALIIDDQKGFLDVTAYSLEQLGFESQLACCGQEGVNRYTQEGPFDIVITDFEMPNGNGEWVVQKIRAISPEQPIIVMSSTAQYLQGFSGPHIRTLDKEDLFYDLPILLKELKLA